MSTHTMNPTTCGGELTLLLCTKLFPASVAGFPVLLVEERKRRVCMALWLTCSPLPHTSPDSWSPDGSLLVEKPQKHDLLSGAAY